MNPKRRTVLKTFAVGGLLVLGTGVLSPRDLWAAWPESAFRAADLDNALGNLFDGAEIEESSAVSLTAPDIAENGAVVPVTVSTDLPNVESINIFVEHNPSPLIASFELTPEAVPEVSTRMKMAGTSDVIAVVKSEGKLYATRKEVKVTIGGCGG